MSGKIFELVQWIKARLNDLINKAYQRDPGSEELTVFNNRYREERPGDSFRRGKAQVADREIRKKALVENREVKVDSEDRSADRLLQESGSTVILADMYVDPTSPSRYETNWLSHFGFERSPFQRLEAGSEEYAEPGFLSNCFVDPNCFSDILGQANAPTTMILFAKRGEGKTAFRVQMDYLCQNGGVPDNKTGQSTHALSVPHIHMREVAKKLQAQEASPLQFLEIHVSEILERTMPQFIELLVRADNIKNSVIQAPKGIRLDLNWYIDSYSRYLSQLQIDVLHKIGFRFPLDTPTLELLKNRTELSPLDHLEHWCRLIHDIGIKAMYVLVDGLDEIASTAADFREAYRLFEPLIINRDLIDKTPHFALKCFVPSEMETLIMTDTRSRPELIPFFHIQWTPDRLAELLRQRMQYFRLAAYQIERPGFDEFCVPELYGKVEQDLISSAGNNPRNLLKLCDLMIKAHCRAVSTSQVDLFKLTPEDLVSAKVDFEKWYKREDEKPESIKAQQERYDIRGIIERGESEQVEFKASMLCDQRSGEKNDGLKMVLGKEIAGMLNRSGGVILIGVSDDKKITGIEGDFALLGPRNKNRPDSKKQDEDGFQLALIDLITSYIGKHILGLLDCYFEEVEGHIICMIDIRPSQQPIYFGNEELFFMRSGTSNLKLSASEIVAYVKDHW